MKRTLAKIVGLLTVLVLVAAPSLALSTAEEVRVGQEAAARFEAAHGVVTDPAMVGRLDRIAASMMPYVQRKDLPWRFRIINVDAFNAAAFPGGFIYVTRGLMNGLTDEEVAFVVGHEIAHVEHRHSVKQLQSAQMRRLGLIAIAVGATGGNVDRGTATLVQLADGVIGSQHSQADESESDRTGLRLMAQAGYDPAFALSALQKLAAQSGGGTPGFLNTLLGSHPLPRERVAQGEALIIDVPYQVTVPPAVHSSSGEERLYMDAAEALEYSLSLLGHGHLDALARQAERVALNQGAPEYGVSVIRQRGDKRAGLSDLENRLLSSPEIANATSKLQFGVAVVETGQDSFEAVVLLRRAR